MMLVDITFDKFHFTTSRGSAIQLLNTTNVTIQNGSLTKVGGSWGIEMNSTKGTTIQNMTFEVFNVVVYMLVILSSVDLHLNQPKYILHKVVSIIMDCGNVHIIKPSIMKTLLVWLFLTIQ